MSKQLTMEQIALGASLPFETRFYIKGLGKIQVDKTVDPGNGLTGIATFYLKGEIIATYSSPFFGDRVLTNRRKHYEKTVVNFAYQEELIAHVLQIDPDTIEYYGLGGWETPSQLLDDDKN